MSGLGSKREPKYTCDRCRKQPASVWLNFPSDECVCSTCYLLEVNFGVVNYRRTKGDFDRFLDGSSNREDL